MLIISALTAAGVSARDGTIITPVDIELDGYGIMENGDRAMLIGGVTYVPLRRFCGEFGSNEINWNESSRTAKVIAAGLDISAAVGKAYITVNGRPFYSGASNLLHGGTLYVPVRSLAKAYGLTVKWCASETGSLGYVSLTGGLGRAESAADVYDAEVLYWLSRIISAESRGESLMGQIAVGNVVLNRTRDESFPDTVYDVIFDTEFGVQFTPIINGTIYEEPAESSIIAAKICLEGYSISDDILYFLNESISTNMWVSNNRPYVMTLGNHAFYS
ncbi:MAG: cell wall hydrolase [Clostridia bacterium]|nr:cell wall hydrolase [Clostridia bacterium]